MGKIKQRKVEVTGITLTGPSTNQDGEKANFVGPIGDGSPSTDAYSGEGGRGSGARQVNLHADPLKAIPIELGRPTNRTMRYGAGKFFNLDGLTIDGKWVGIDWHKGPGKGHTTTSGDALTAIVAALTSIGGSVVSLFGRSLRLANLGRGRPYDNVSPLSGRNDHEVMGPDNKPLNTRDSMIQIGRSEVYEESGGSTVDGTTVELFKNWVPTMSCVSSEADCLVGTVVCVPPDAKSVGDGGQMALTGRRPVTRAISDAFLSARSGGLNEASRWSVAMRTYLQSVGYLVEIGRFDDDHSASKKKRAHRETSSFHEALRRVNQPARNVREPHRDWFPVIKRVVDVHRVDAGQIVFHLEVDHAYRDHRGRTVELGQPHDNMILHTNYDVAKVVEYYVDPVLGPMVKPLRQVERPALASIDKGKAARAVVLPDVDEIKIPLPFVGEDVEEILRQAATMDFAAIAFRAVKAKVLGRVTQLGHLDVASTGASDLAYHFFAVETDKPKSRGAFVPIATAIASAKNAEAATQEALWRLADKLGWMCSKGMSVASYAKQKGIRVADLPKLI